MSANLQGATHPDLSMTKIWNPATVLANADVIGRLAVRCSLVGVLLVIGAMKFHRLRGRSH